MPDTGALKRNFDFVSSAIESGKIVSGYAVGFGGVAEALAKMSFGNGIGADVKVDEATLFDNSYGSIVVESTEPLDFRPPSCWDIPRRRERSRSTAKNAARGALPGQYRTLCDGLSR